MVVFAVPALASTKINERSFSNQKSWMLPSYLSLAESQPAKLIEMSKEQFSKETLDRAKKERGLSYAWQDRMALLGGLSQLFNPEAKSRLREFRSESFKTLLKN